MEAFFELLILQGRQGDSVLPILVLELKGEGKTNV